MKKVESKKSKKAVLSTTNEIFNILSQSEGWHNLVKGDKKMSVDLTFAIKDALRSLDGAAKVYDETRLEIMHRFVETKEVDGKTVAARDEDGQVKFLSDKHRSNWDKQFTELATKEIEIDFSPVKIKKSDIYGRLGPQDLIVLEDKGIIELSK